jgi:hypothetical protein
MDPFRNKLYMLCSAEAYFENLLIEGNKASSKKYFSKKKKIEIS